MHRLAERRHLSLLIGALSVAAAVDAARARADGDGHVSTAAATTDGVAADGVAADAATRGTAEARPRARLLDHTAHALRGGEVRLGLTHWAVGLLDELTVGTVVLPWLLPAVSDFGGANLYLESEPWTDGRHAVALHAGALLAWPKGAGISGAVWVLPLDVRYSLRVTERVSAHAQLGYTAVIAGANAQSGDYDVEGNAAAPIVRTEASVEWRLGDALALLGTVAWAPWVGDAVGEARVSVGPAISGRGEIAISTEAIQHAWSVVAALVYTAGIVDLRIGFGYGDLFLIDTGLVVPLGDFFPELAVDVRF